MPPSVFGIGVGLYVYDMLTPFVFVEASYSGYVTETLALGVFAGLRTSGALRRLGIQVVLGDTSSSAVALHVGTFMGDNTWLLGVGLWLFDMCVSLDYSLPDPGYTGEVHVSLSYGVRF